MKTQRRLSAEFHDSLFRAISPFVGKDDPPLVSPRLAEKLESTIGLAEPDFAFRDALDHAVLLAYGSYQYPPKRGSALRRDLQLIAGRAADVAGAIEALTTAIDQQTCFPSFPRLPEIGKMFADMAAEAHRAGGSIEDAGGPRRRIGFDLMVRGLADAYARATGKPAAVLWNAVAGRYYGRFVDMIEITTDWLAAEPGMQDFAAKTPLARGKAIERSLHSMDKTLPEKN